MFVAANNWCDGIEPPPSLWLAAPNDSRIVRDAKGKRTRPLFRREAVETADYRLPEVAVGDNQ
jgi:hypothetical protein